MTSIPSTVQWIHLQTDSNKDQIGSEKPEAVCKKMLRNIKGIIFDLDGTLYDNALIAFRLISAHPTAIFQIRNERVVRSRLAGKDFSSPANFNQAFFNELGKTCFRPAEKMQNWYFNRYMPVMMKVLKKHYKPRNGLKELLQRIDSSKNKTQYAIYSDYPHAEKRLEALGLPPVKKIRFYGPESFGALKPAVRPFMEIARDFNLQPEEILVIGDREDTDGLGAFNSKMHFFCLETGRRRYFRLDPNRRRPEQEPQGPTLLMYAGRWDKLIEFLFDKINHEDA